MEIAGCLICQAELVYSDNAIAMKCSICNKSMQSNAKCVNNHFICDACHESGAMDLIESFCLNSKSKNPILLANQIMNNSKIKMHGPEHHYLVPAVLITTYYNTLEKPAFIKEKLRIARQRAKNVLGGFCGFYGTCGAGVGTGIFMSVITKSTPLSTNSWSQSNLITANSLLKIAEQGGPRCCKRDSYIAIETAIDFILKSMNVKLETSEVTCTFFDRNKECKLTDCAYY